MRRIVSKNWDERWRDQLGNCYYGQDGNTEGPTQSLVLRMEKRKYFARYLECGIDKIDGKLDVGIERM